MEISVCADCEKPFDNIEPLYLIQEGHLDDAGQFQADCPIGLFHEHCWVEYSWIGNKSWEQWAASKRGEE